jgi:uncharacterized iron-regulated membrane protein
MKIFFRNIHLYLSLAAGLVILTACLTGAILVFEKDLQMAMNEHRYYVQAGAARLSPDQLVRSVKDSFPKARTNSIKIYTDPQRSAEVNVAFPAEMKTVPAGNNGRATPAPRQPGYTIFVDPYNGKVLEKYSYRETWFYTVFALHRWLLGGEGSIGKYIVGISTFIFLFILITGVILWWPKTRAILKQRTRIKWSAGWKRLNHDLHMVFGFYSCIFLFIFAFTGLAWSFEWFNKGIYSVTNSPLKAAPPPRSAYDATKKKIGFAVALDTARTVYPGAVSYTVQAAKDSTEAITVSALRKDALHESATDAAYIDQYSGRLLGTLRFEERSLGARVRSSFKPIHTGSIWGTPSKILAFIVCLFGVSFPITGTILWLNRLKKKNGKGE